MGDRREQTAIKCYKESRVISFEQHRRQKIVKPAFASVGTLIQQAAMTMPNPDAFWLTARKDGHNFQGAVISFRYILQT